MRAAGHRWGTLILAVVVVSTLGCRFSRPFSSSIQVSQTSDSDFPEIEAPSQRLATASSFGTRRSEVARDLKPRSPDKSEMAADDRSGAGKTEFTLADRSLSSATKTNGKEGAAAVKTVSMETLAKDLSPESAELMNAFREFPPEVQREALRRIAAVTSNRDDKTSPSKERSEAESAKNDAQEPESTDDKESASPPKSNTTAPKEETAAAPKRSADSEPAVRTIPDSIDQDESSVERALGSPADNADSSVTHASGSTASNNESSANDSLRAHLEAEQDADTKGLSDQTLYATLLKRLSTAVPGENEADRNARLIKLRHLMVLSGDPDSAVEQVEGLSEAEQEYLRHQLLGLWMMIDPQGHPVPSRRFTTALPQIREATKFAGAATDSLDLRSLAFCTEIESYGQIKTFPGNRFNAGQQVILYCEIENFTVNKTDEGFETQLQGSYEIYDSDNKKVISQVLPADTQVSANYLRDYFIAYQMHLPTQLSSGTYRLQLTMEDVVGKKYGQASIPLEIVK